MSRRDKRTKKNQREEEVSVRIIAVRKVVTMGPRTMRPGDHAPRVQALAHHVLAALGHHPPFVEAIFG
ncbi:unnamed protein product [Cochlearia groenlandica]